MTPRPRSDRGQSKLPPAVQEAILNAKQENLRRSIDQLILLMEHSGLAARGMLPRSSVHRLLRLLLAPGSSLGGARPKASIRDRGGDLGIAKFPRKDDETNAVLWEAVALRLAAKAGIPVPDWRIEPVADKPVLLLRRFDRVQGRPSERIPFLSAMSMLGVTDNESRSYLEFVDALRRYGASPEQDIHALWRRIVFNILISNTDDHWHNHAFLYTGSDGWRLAPAYDLNPVPTDIRPRPLIMMTAQPRWAWQ